ncbi:Sperm flagellar protein 1 [Chytriomyces hyalinus]|nr:Sperm flagellar protein 1 [Chytriomyces hyalinus]
MNNIALSEESIASLLSWIDEIPISKPKKNITRDFSDGVATAEVVHHFCPKLVELFMYSPANAVSQKMYNWNTLNQKVFRKLGYIAQPELISCIVANKPGYVEYLLFELRKKIDAYVSSRRHNSSIPNDTDSVSESSYLPSLPNSAPQMYQQQQLQYQQQQQYLQQQQQHQFLQQQQQQHFQNIPGAAESVHGNLGGGGDLVGGVNQAGGVGFNPGPMKKGASTVGVGVHGQEKDFMIRELQETVQILQLKITKLEQLLILKDRRIDELVHAHAKSEDNLSGFTETTTESSDDFELAEGDIIEQPTRLVPTNESAFHQILPSGREDNAGTSTPVQDEQQRQRDQTRQQPRKLETPLPPLAQTKSILSDLPVSSIAYSTPTTASRLSFYENILLKPSGSQTPAHRTPAPTTNLQKLLNAYQPSSSSSNALQNISGVAAGESFVPSRSEDVGGSGGPTFERGESNEENTLGWNESPNIKDAGHGSYRNGEGDGTSPSGDSRVVSGTDADDIEEHATAEVSTEDGFQKKSVAYVDADKWKNVARVKPDGDEFEPSSDYCETPSDVFFFLSVPGAKSEDVEIDINESENSILVTGYTEEATPANARFIMSERKVGRFRRSFKILSRVVAGAAEASVFNGVLHIRIPKLQ